eukprot:scaffold65718_cov21-Tisochrysis_lutea.AAC.1
MRPVQSLEWWSLLSDFTIYTCTLRQSSAWKRRRQNNLRCGSERMMLARSLCSGGWCQTAAQKACQCT